MIEFILIAVISLALIFGVMDIARLSWTMFHLHGAAFAAANWWMLAVDAQVDDALGEKILEKLRKSDGRQTA